MIRRLRLGGILGGLVALLWACNEASFGGSSKAPAAAPIRPQQSSATETVTRTQTKTEAETVTGTDASEEPTPTAPDTAFQEAKSRVGINFDDGGLPGSPADLDYNDAVLCFQGQFKVDPEKGRVISAKAQSTMVVLSRRANCDNGVRISILHADGTSEGPREYRTAKDESVNLTVEFQAGSELKVEFLAGEGCNFHGRVISMSDAAASKVEVDVCRTDGG